jgi:hypothetical protein
VYRRGPTENETSGMLALTCETTRYPAMLDA